MNIPLQITPALALKMHDGTKIHTTRRNAIKSNTRPDRPRYVIIKGTVIVLSVFGTQPVLYTRVVTSVQTIEVTLGVSPNVLLLAIDGIMQSDNEKQFYLENSGFSSNREMYNFFLQRLDENEEYNGFIYHWTDFRYE